MAEIVVRRVDKQDYNKAAEFAAVGMHLDKFVRQKFVLRLYSRSFWYEELLRSTCTYGAYCGGEFKGALLAAMDGEDTVYHGIKGKLYVWICRLFAGEEGAAYDNANKEMLDRLKRTTVPDGEITFLAADPEKPVKGVGTALLSAFERDHPGKTVYVYTDDTCSYGFYDRRGFVRASETVLPESDGKTDFSLRCFLYYKKIAGSTADKDQGVSP